MGRKHDDSDRSEFAQDVILGDNVKVLRIECSGGARTDPWPIWPIIIFIVACMVSTPILIIATINLIINGERPLPGYIKRAVEKCAVEGPLDAGRRQDEGKGLAHPPGLCKSVKEIIWDSIDYYEIADVICEHCGNDTENGREEIADGANNATPLALGGREIIIEDGPVPRAPGGDETDEGCMTPVIGIEVHEDTGNRSTKYCSDDNYCEEHLDLPPFCTLKATNPSHIFWSLLDRPRVHYTRTGMNQQTTKEKASAAPYAVFIARQARNPNLVKVFVLYVDYITERPNIIEIPFESLGGRNRMISSDEKIHLINNLKFDSDKYQITFQIGTGVQEITIAGYDFGPQSTDNTVLDVRNRDASGSYVVCLSDTGGVKRVYRVDNPGRGCRGA